VGEFGVGGGSNFDFHGFAGYDANRSVNYTVRSFTDKRYVDSSGALKVNISDTATMLTPYARKFAYVPYTGATTNVNLGAYNLTANTVQASDLLYAAGLTNGKNIGLRFNSYQNRGIISSKDNSTGLPILIGDTTDQSSVLVPNTTDATSTTAAAVMLSGGLAVAKKLYAAQIYGYRGSSGAAAPPSNGSGLILESNSSTGITILTPDANASRIYFGTTSNSNNAFIYSDYNSGAQSMLLGVGTSTTGALTQLSITGSNIKTTGRLNVNGATDNANVALNITGGLKTSGYTVATLPTGVTGLIVYVTDALAPTYNTTVIGGGAITIPVFYNGSNWTCH
jgi:hypothetical protein